MKNLNDAKIEAAVMPLKAEAMDRAEKESREIIARLFAKLADANWKVNDVAPWPHTQQSRKDYMTQKGKRNFVDSITSEHPENTRFVRYDQADYRRAPNLDRVESIVKGAREDAAAQYDSFVGKLSAKIGATVEATLTGSHVWGYSFLKVVKADGTGETWKTQMILNVSKLGKLFNQFPTRKVKA